MLRDADGRAKAAIVAVLCWIIADLGHTVANLTQIYFYDGLDPEAPGMTLLVASGVQLLTTLIAFILSARWIMRVNANAHAISMDMSISPGWNVGWFFVPIASMWKPFQGLRETWQASAGPNAAYGEVPSFMRLWWGFWLASNILSNISVRMSMFGSTPDMVITTSWIDVAIFVIDVPLAYLFIWLIRELTEMQRNNTAYAEVFA